MLTKINSFFEGLYDIIVEIRTRQAEEILRKMQLKDVYCSLDTVRRGNWLIKASSLDDQLMIVCYNPKTVERIFKMFYSEETAYSFIESLYDKNSKAVDR